jgi:hypothetical protein
METTVAMMGQMVMSEAACGAHDAQFCAGIHVGGFTQQPVARDAHTIGERHTCERDPVSLQRLCDTLVHSARLWRKKSGADPLKIHSRSTQDPLKIHSRSTDLGWILGGS